MVDMFGPIPSSRTTLGGWMIEALEDSTRNEISKPNCYTKTKKEKEVREYRLAFERKGIG
jgi:hypothetical protein